MVFTYSFLKPPVNPVGARALRTRWRGPSQRKTCKEIRRGPGEFRRWYIRERPTGGTTAVCGPRFGLGGEVV
jgi:hypothetical protein